MGLALHSARPLTLAALAVLAASRVSAGPVYGWRGAGDGHYPAATPPLEWSAESNVAWKAKVGHSYSSPVVVGERVLVAAEPDRVLCLNAADGRVMWSKSTAAADLPESQRTNVVDYYAEGTSGNTAATPASDGQRVFMVFGNGLVTALDLKTGQRQWLRHIATEPTSKEGRSASPVLAEGKLLVHLTALYALDPLSGSIAWDQPEATDGYGTPAVTRIGNTDAVVTPKGDVVRAADGKILASGLAWAVYSSPLIREGVVYFGDAASVAVRLPTADARDTVTAKEIWSDALDGQVYSSPLLLEGLLYVVDRTGRLTAFDTVARTKTEVELACGAAGGQGDATTVYASIALAGGHLFVSDDAGATVVLTPGKEPKPIGVNRLPEGAGATPAFAGRRIFLRGGDNLYCIGR
jgi:outer membrane protein assembly factor BamB